MKRLGFLLLAIFISTLFSCDKISPPFTEDTDENVDTNAVIRKVLLEDYTGHRCVNCPTAAVTAMDLKALYGEKIVVMAVHAGSWAIPFAGTFSYDFRSAAGTEYDATFGISTVGNPNGMVNRKMVASSIIIAPTAWGSTIAGIIDLPPDAEIEINNTYNSASKLLNTEIKSEFLNSMTGLYKLCVLILEDSIVKPQANNNSNLGPDPITNYMHRHVLRGAINSTWGDSLAIDPTVTGAFITKNYTNYALNPAWDENHCIIIAFIFNAVTNEIVQVEEKKMK
jgi:hypothetical protein